MLFWKKKKSPPPPSVQSPEYRKIMQLDEKTRQLKVIQYAKLKKKGDMKLMERYFSPAEQKVMEKLLLVYQKREELQSLREINKMIDHSQSSMRKREEMNDNIKIMTAYAKKKPKSMAELFRAVMLYPTPGEKKK
ncbi:MAG: hypothetical protein KBA26_11295 [Candidatus Delongbacteria bacterium]|nr:hypothetical protein [Candidatus Delongbacteria bacterium]